MPGLRGHGERDNGGGTFENSGIIPALFLIEIGKSGSDLLRFRQRYRFHLHLAHQRGKAGIGTHEVEARIGVHPGGPLIVLIDTFG